LHPLLDLRPWPRALLQYPLLILTAVLLGGSMAFIYSYAPLHRAKDWEISYLQERLTSRTEQVEGLEANLRQAQGAIEGQPSNGQLDALNAQLDEAQGLSGSLQKQVRDLESKLTKMTRSRDSWKRKHASVVAEAEAASAVASSVAPTPSPAPLAVPEATATPTTEDLSAPPASPPAASETGSPAPR